MRKIMEAFTALSNYKSVIKQLTGGLAVNNPDIQKIKEAVETDMERMRMMT